MRVMTWNLLTDSAVEVPSWAARAPVLAAGVADLAPTVLGTQEGSAGMLDDLVSRLGSRYRWVGEGRAGRGQDETCAVVYDSTQLTLLDVRNRWLSDAPEQPGSRACDADLPRIFTSARFHDSETGVIFSVVNTHLDHTGEQARVAGATIVAAEAAAGPAVVTGDFNAVAEASEAYDVALASGLVDALAPRDRLARRLRTFTGRDRSLIGEGEQIDWILVTRNVAVTDAWVEEGPQAYASDHRPVLADLVFA